jgi:hypothetical protein
MRRWAGKARHNQSEGPHTMAQKHHAQRSEPPARMKIKRRNPMSIAIMMLGGPAGLAELLGLNEQQVHRLLKRPLGKWKGGYVFDIARATGIPTGVFLADLGIVDFA